MARAVSILSRVSPRTAAWLAGRLFCTPPPPRPLGRAADVLEEGEPLTLTVRGCVVRAWRWGDGPAIHLLHGWGGRAGQLTPMVSTLVRDGFSVIAIDAPAHGDSPGRRSSLVHFRDTLLEAARRWGAPHGVVGHSMGGAALTLALLTGLPAEAAVLVATPADPTLYWRAFLRAIEVPVPLLPAFDAHLERRFDLPRALASIIGQAPRMKVPALLVHDRDDHEVPSADSEAVARAWPGAELLLTRGLGHHRILRDPGVIERASAFFRCVAGAAGSGCEQAAGV